ncbi:MAG: non-canonical purine NTP pyrophosphatase [Candidatus Peribacteraceae bacterium]|nr:non-canonical purine NTP pyrophosphatase [Candidatus Peribacteraceae bacterium]
MRLPRGHQGQDGTSFFVTTVTEGRKKIFSNSSIAKLVVEMIHDYNRRGHYWLSEYVVMPDHVHLLIAPKEKPLSACMHDLKRTIAQMIHEKFHKSVGQERSCPTDLCSVDHDQLWQHSFHDIIIRSNEHREALRHYIHQNPVLAGLCENPKDYPFSSINQETDRHFLSIGAHYPDARPPLLIATSNRGKVQELSGVLSTLPLDILTPLDLPYIEETPQESGSTFEENALEKARFFSERSGLPTVADDSGIIVEALGEELGLHTRRWGAGPAASDAEWIDFFLKRMRKEKNKRARFVCVLAYVDPLGATHTFEGRCEGIITPTLEADYLPGLPISACFRPDGHSAVFSALTIEQKNSTSHRGKAAHSLKKHLQDQLSET